jgi:hypothetical protein
MAQLALWDKSRARRVLVDQQFENFALIRSRILNEYAKVFALKALPIEFLNSSPPLLFESLLFALFTAFCSWVAWSAYQRGQTGLGVFFLCFAVATLLSLFIRHLNQKIRVERHADPVVFRLQLHQQFLARDLFDVEQGISPSFSVLFGPIVSQAQNYVI